MTSAAPPPPEAPGRAAGRPDDAAFNYAVLVADVTCFYVALAFLDAATVLPRLVGDLGGGPVVLGLFLALRQGGYLLPQLFVAHRLQGRARYLPFLRRVCFFGRVWLFPAALLLFLYGRSAPEFALAALAVAYAVLWIGDGAGGVPWTAIVGRAIPATRRGGFFATTQVLGGVGRIGVGFVVAGVLGEEGVAFPANAGLLVLGCAVFMALSFTFLALIREPAPEEDRPSAPGPLPLGAYLRTLPGLLSGRADFARLALVQVLGAGLVAAYPFYVAVARDALPGLPPGIEGRFLIVYTVGSLIGAPVWGRLTDRHGPRAALLALLAVSALSPVLAGVGAAGGGLAAFFAAYACLGAVMEGGWAVFTNYLLETIPEPEQPTHLGMLSVLNAPTLAFPLVAGTLVRAFGPPSTLFLAVALLVPGFFIALGLRNPRRVHCS